MSGGKSTVHSTAQGKIAEEKGKQHKVLADRLARAMYTHGNSGPAPAREAAHRGHKAALLRWDLFGATYRFSAPPGYDAQVRGIRFWSREDAVAFLSRYRHIDGCFRDLRRILHYLGHVSVARVDDRALISQVASAMALGTVRVAPEVADKFVVRAEKWELPDIDYTRRLYFDSFEQARRLLLQMNGGAEAALELLIALTGDAKDEQLKPAQAVDRLATALNNETLALEAIDFGYSKFRLYRVKRSIGVPKAIRQATLPPTPRPQVSIPPPRTAPKPKLPRIAGPQTSLQAQALRMAAQSGTPFCEECAALAR